MEAHEAASAETASAEKRPATFQGRLQLDGFRYRAPETRSRRIAAAAAPMTAASPSASPSTGPFGGGGGGGGSSSSSSPATSSRSSRGASRSRKRVRRGTGYAPPSTYAHLPLLADAVAPDLLVLLVGLNPGVQTARSGHAYAHPSNLFWKLLFSSGVTPRLCRADEDRRMPALYSLGLTNIVARPSRSGAELSRREMDDGVALLDAKARRWRPETVCIVGKSIWESIWRVRHRRPVGSDFCYGWQPDTENMGAVEGQWPGARVFVARSTSGLAASLSLAEKQAIWAELGAWVKRRRAERGAQTDKGEASSSC